MKTILGTNLKSHYLQAGEDIRDAAVLHQHSESRDKAAYFLDLKILSDTVDNVRQSFPGTVAYAVKSNYSHDIMHTMFAKGLVHFDVASLQEMALIHHTASAHDQKPTLFFHNPWKSAYEIQTAYQHYDVRHFAVNNKDEIQKVAACTDHDPKIIQTIRLNMGGNAVFDLKEGGAPVSHVKKLATEVEKTGQKYALTFHVGSQCEDPARYAVALDEIKYLMVKHRLHPEFLNIGGGIPARYTAKTPPLAEFFTAIQDHAPRDIPLFCEPGRALTASCEQAIIPIKTIIKNRTGRDVIVLATGIHGALSEHANAGGAWVPNCEIITKEKPGAKNKTYDLRGPTCHISKDIMPFQFKLPVNLSSNDILIVKDVGAYNASLGSDFNGYKPEDRYVANRGPA